MTTNNVSRWRTVSRVISLISALAAAVVAIVFVAVVMPIVWAGAQDARAELSETLVAVYTWRWLLVAAAATGALLLLVSCLLVPSSISRFALSAIGYLLPAVALTVPFVWMFAVMWSIALDGITG